MKKWHTPHKTKFSNIDFRMLENFDIQTFTCVYM